jgi:hypothetical protein
MEAWEINSNVVDRVNLHLAVDVATLVHGLPCLGTFTELIRRGDVELTIKHVICAYCRLGTFSSMDRNVPFLIESKAPLKDSRQYRVSHEDN